MNNELLAVVDETDCVIERRPRHEIHALGLRHRAVHILVFNDLDQLLMQKRSLKKDLNPGLWDTSAAGHVDDGENYEDCAPRELREELGIEAELRMLFKLEASPALGMEFIQVYRCRHNGPFSIAADEIDEIRWFEPDAIDQQVETDSTQLTETFKTIWRTFRS